MNNVGIIGCGAWGTTLAKVLAENGHGVMLWCHQEKFAKDIASHRENQTLLPGIALPENITPTTSLEETCRGKDLVVFVVASQYYASTVAKSLQYFSPRTYLLSATKGLDEKSLLRPSEIIKRELPEEFHSRIAVLSGPNLSREIAEKKVSATVISSRDSATASTIQNLFNNKYLRVYTNNDVPGTEWGGALKNIMAIASGIADGLQLGNNAKSAIMVRGLVETVRFGVHMGAQAETFFGLAGLGDLITTCSSTLSRNHTVGAQLGEGREIGEILSGMTAVAEGVNTAKWVRMLAGNKGIEMPVTEQVYSVLFENKPVADAVRDLMSRETKSEQPL